MKNRIVVIIQAVMFLCLLFLSVYLVGRIDQIPVIEEKKPTVYIIGIELVPGFYRTEDTWLMQYAVDGVIMSAVFENEDKATGFIEYLKSISGEFVGER